MYNLITTIDNKQLIKLTTKLTEYYLLIQACCACAHAAVRLRPAREAGCASVYRGNRGGYKSLSISINNTTVDGVHSQVGTVHVHAHCAY